jgi:hypothetical protein
MNYCSPSKKTISKKTCYDNNDLITIAKAYNQVVKKKQPICNGNSCLLATKTINDVNKYTNDELYEELSNRLGKICKSDMCWTDLNFIKTIKDHNLRDSLLYFTFKPKSTKTITSWFNTNNINEIMQQYQDLYKESFYFLGAQPCDYSKIITVNWNKLKKNDNIGIIFNTDSHLQPGKHWLAIFIDNVNKKLDYFDSLGDLPNKNISSFLKHFKDYNFTINKTEHQKGNENCGVYSCYFIIQRLKGLSFDKITERIITDKMMTDYRSFLFRPKV